MYVPGETDRETVTFTWQQLNPKLDGDPGLIVIVFGSPVNVGRIIGVPMSVVFLTVPTSVTVPEKPLTIEALRNSEVAVPPTSTVSDPVPNHVCRSKYGASLKFALCAVSGLGVGVP